MIETICGNLLDRPNGINVIVHSANTRRGGTHGSGIAAQIVRRWPHVQISSNRHYSNFERRLRYEKYGKVRQPSHEEIENALLGTILEIAIGPRAFLINLYGQHLGRFSKDGIPTDYDAFRSGAKKVEELCSSYFRETLPLSVPIVGIPHGIGCGLGGGDWKIVEEIFRDTFKNAEYPVYFVKFSGQAP